MGLRSLRVKIWINTFEENKVFTSKLSRTNRNTVLRYLQNTREELANNGPFFFPVAIFVHAGIPQPNTVNNVFFFSSFKN